MKPFRAPDKTLGSLNSKAAASLLAAAADIALVMDAEGVIRDIAFGSDELSQDIDGKWLGLAWTDTVTVESRPKIEALLKEAGATNAPRWRHVNHPTGAGPDVPVLYSAVQIDTQGHVVAIGRNLQAMAALQQRLIDAQQSMEREYARLRHAETRYRLLFEIASEAVLIVDATNQRIVEANPAATHLLREAARRLVGRVFPEGFDNDSSLGIQTLLAAVRTTGRGEDVRASLSEGRREFMVSASLFRQDNGSFFLVRLTPLQGDGTNTVVPRSKSRLLEAVEHSPDGFVVTDVEGQILTANRAFLDFAELASEERARGEPLERWVGRVGVDMNVLLANLRQHGVVRLFATTLRGEYGTTSDVEISAVGVASAEQPCMGFVIRNVGRRVMTDTRSARELPRSVEQLTELVGRVSLKDLVREATDVIERLCIEAALELTGDNRASAAEMLGLSRQSLYVKLRRYGLGDLGPESDRGDVAATAD